MNYISEITINFNRKAEKSAPAWAKPVNPNIVGRLGDKTSLRSDQVVKEGKIGDAMSDEYIEMALRNQSGGGIKTGSTGAKELVRYDPLQIEGLNWCMITTTAGTVTQIEQTTTVINEVNEIVGTIPCRKSPVPAGR